MQGETNAVIVKVSRDDEKSAWSKEFTQANHLDLSLYHRIPDLHRTEKVSIGKVAFGSVFVLLADDNTQPVISKSKNEGNEWCF